VPHVWAETSIESTKAPLADRAPPKQIHTPQDLLTKEALAQCSVVPCSDDKLSIATVRHVQIVQKEVLVGNMPPGVHFIRREVHRTLPDGTLYTISTNWVEEQNIRASAANSSAKPCSTSENPASSSVACLTQLGRQKPGKWVYDI